MTLDRLPDNEIHMTQELIANMLGVRREGVTEAVGRLKKDGILTCTRGHITVLDRPELEKQVCECYAVVTKEYDRLLDTRGPPPLTVVVSSPAASLELDSGW